MSEPPALCPPLSPPMHLYMLDPTPVVKHTELKKQTNKRCTTSVPFQSGDGLNQFPQIQPPGGVGASPANTSICMQQVARAEEARARWCSETPAVTRMKWSSQAWNEDTGQWARTVTAAKWTWQWCSPLRLMGMISPICEMQVGERESRKSEHTLAVGRCIEF